jgi:hypothetical protein
VRKILPLLGTVGTLAAVRAATGFGDAGLLVLGGALALRGRPGSPARLPVLVVTTAGLGLAFVHSRALGDGLTVLLYLAGRLGWRLGPRWAAAGRAALAPLVGLFVAPPVALRDDPASGLLQVLLACAAATAWTLLLPPAAERSRSGARAASVRTRLAVQGTVALAAALAVGQLAFGRHWPWVVVTVLAVSLRGTSRGDVAVTAAERLVGAAAGTVLATLAGDLDRLGPYPATGLVLAVLSAGLLLRDRHPTVWPAATTTALGLLYALLGQPTGPAVLGDRLLAIVAGGACAVVPALVLAPVRTRDVVRGRTGLALRALGAALREGTEDRVRAADAELDALHHRSRPLRLVRRESPEARAATAVLACRPLLHDPARRRELADTVRDLAARYGRTTGGER